MLRGTLACLALLCSGAGIKAGAQGIRAGESAFLWCTGLLAVGAHESRITETVQPCGPSSSRLLTNHTLCHIPTTSCLLLHDTDELRADSITMQSPWIQLCPAVSAGAGSACQISPDAAATPAW